MNENESRKLEDYRYVNEQILLHQKWIVEVFVFSVIVTVAVLGYGLGVFLGAKEEQTVSGLAALIFLVPLAIILPSAHMMYLFRSAIFNLIGYSIEIHQLDFHGYDRKSYDEEYKRVMRRKGVLKQSLVYPFVTYWLLFAILSLLYSLGVAGVLPKAEEVCCGWTWLILLPLILLLAITWYYCQLPSHLQDYRDKWRQNRTPQEPTEKA